VDQGQLVSEQIEAGAKLIRAFDAEYKPLQAAFWVKDYDTGVWQLILASDQINDSNVRMAYHELHRLHTPESRLWLDWFQVRIRNIDDRVVQAVLDIQRQYPQLLPLRLGPPSRLGDDIFADAYIYALPSLTAEQPASR
jgi:hypothetical protein